MIVDQWLRKQGYTVPFTDQRRLQKEWLSWYKGFVPEKHEYTVFNGQEFRQARRRTLGMAKIICEDYGALLMNEHVQITSDTFPDLPELLKKNQFYTRMNRLAELTMALGTGAIVEFIGAGGVPTIDYIRADMVYPLSWDGECVTECAFASRKVSGRGGSVKTSYYIQMHVKEGNGWRIRNVWLDDSGHELPPPDGVQAESPFTPIPLFQIVRPNVVNVADFDSPLGASVFANALEQLNDCDIVWDSYINEFVLGKKRLMLPTSLSKIMIHKTESGDEEVVPLFDPHDALFYVYDAGEAQKPIELDMNLRTSEHEQGLQRCLDTLSKKCGLGVGRYRFDSGNVMTATEVISTKSDLYQSLKRHEKTFGDAIAGMVRALAWLSGVSGDVDVSVKFDDSIIEDENSILDRCIKRVSAGLMSKVHALMLLDGMDHEEAEKHLHEIIQEENIAQAEVERSIFSAGEALGNV